LTTESYFLAYADNYGYNYISYELVEGVPKATFETGIVKLRSVVNNEINSNLSAYESELASQQIDILPQPYVVGNSTYYFDTKEYRLAKFKNEFSEHFDLEYCLVYFVMTEVFMCYDSRGKNCMMASWGPLKEGGEYIWYPIFYDIDTQLGINNTGIPSFEYYINATEEGSYSTNDSVLWMNLFRAFLPEIRSKYYAMRGAGNGIVNVHTGETTTPLKGAAGTDITNTEDELTRAVKHIEKWYSADPEECNSLSMKGDRPLIVKNLDEYYKYISITNNTIGYQDRDGNLITDNGTYFYALQGDRSLSR
jgi:hypothetical protein